MPRLKVVKTAINSVTLSVDLQGNPGARIYRARRASGPYEEVGVARGETYVDTAALEPGKICYYRTAAWTSPWLYPEAEDLKKSRPVQAKIPRAPREKALTLTRKRQTFAIHLGGYLDESNSVTKGPEIYCPGPGHMNPPYDQVFEPNLYVTIENIGDTDLENPWLVANDQRDWFSSATMGREILRIAGGRNATETEKAMATWRFVADEIYDSRAGLSWCDSRADPVKLFNVYGFEGCVADAIATSRLAAALGLEAREIWLGDLAFIDGYGRGRVCSHTIFEARADQAWHLLDTDLIVFFLKRDNCTVAGVEDLSRDLDLLRRSHRNLGLCGRDLPEMPYYYTAFHEGRMVYPPNKGETQALDRYPPPHTMALRLRPGEKLSRYWDNIGKKVIDSPYLHPELRFSNGKLVYRPDLRRPLALKGLESVVNVKQEKSRRDPALHPAQAEEVAELVWKVASPYAIAGARVGLSCRRQTRADGLEVLFSTDGQNWRSLWIATGQPHPARKLDACLELDWFLNPALNDQRPHPDQVRDEGPCYTYYIKVAMWAGSHSKGVGLDAIRFDSDIQCATHSLPSLFCGRNTISYRDENRHPRKVRLSYGWREEHSIRPPKAPELVYPLDGADVQKLDFEFRWKRSGGGSARVDDYHIQVSRYPDFRWCLCPTFDRYVGRTRYAGKTRWQPEFPNLLNPDETYFWRVRARSAQGAWSAWSARRAFVPQGPRLPLALALRRQGRKRILTWSPNPQGNQAVSYRVYGSPERGGFSIDEENLLGTVADTCWVLQKPSKGMSFRVVAVDARGIPSTPSDHIEL